MRRTELRGGAGFGVVAGWRLGLAHAAECALLVVCVVAGRPRELAVAAARE